MSISGTAGSGFTLPPFYSYPPYFTLQPVKEARDRQLSLWSQLILAYCKHHKVFTINTQQDDFPLFKNTNIDRCLSSRAITEILDDMASQGSVEWLDKSKRACFVLWKKVPEWANTIHSFVKTFGLSDTVMTLDELSSGDDVRGTEFCGIPQELLIRALVVLEAQGKCKMFKGVSEERGVKFT
ncbi:subunit of ESCRT-II complex [Haematococcus lacustris]